MRGLKIAHFTDLAQGVGASVFLFESGAVGAYWMCGSAPATHELAALDVASSVPYCHGLVFAGGSAYGLHAAAGAMRYLGERGIGHAVPSGVVPIVPAAAIYDMAHKAAVFPAAEHVYEACLLAGEGNVERGRIGGGTGATVGKLVPNTRCVTGGIGRAEITQADGLQVIAYAVVNAVGDIYDHGKLLAAACDADGRQVNANDFLLAGHDETDLFAGTNTTLAAIFTNAALSKDACQRVARVGSAGLARAISPVFTRFDGDIIFCMSVGNVIASEFAVSAMAAEALRRAVIDAVKDAEIVT